MQVCSDPRIALKSENVAARMAATSMRSQNEVTCLPVNSSGSIENYLWPRVKDEKLSDGNRDGCAFACRKTCSLDFDQNRKLSKHETLQRFGTQMAMLRLIGNLFIHFYVIFHFVDMQTATALLKSSSRSQRVDINLTKAICVRIRMESISIPMKHFVSPTFPFSRSVDLLCC